MKNEESCIRGKGFGSSHTWRNLGSTMVGDGNVSRKHTRYQCRKCEVLFRHFYDMEPDIFSAMHKAGIPEFCRDEDSSSVDKKQPAMYHEKEGLPHWAVRHDEAQDDPERYKKLREYNSSSIHGEYIHPDRFRYSHKVMDEKEHRERSFTCGRKYDANDTSQCPFCMGWKYGRSEKEALELADATFGFPPSMDLQQVLTRWAKESRKAARAGSSASKE